MTKEEHNALLRAIATLVNIDLLSMEDRETWIRAIVAARMKGFRR